MIDFHSHILPKVDDGAKNLETAIKMIDISAGEGVQYICATPHFIPEECEIPRDAYFSKLEELKNSVKDKNIEIVSGLEIYINPNVPTLYKEGKVWPINNKKYMLLELPMNQFPMYTEEVFYELRILGITPVIAHPERNLELMKNPELLIRLIEQGALAQMNSGSLRGKYGKAVEDFAKILVKRNLIHMLGSDGHNLAQRSPKIKEGFNLVKTLNKDLFHNIRENELKIIMGEDIETLPILELKSNFLKSIMDIFKR